MAAFNWTEAWATGNTMIDAEHKELFRAINELLEACTSGHGQDRIASTMKFLIDYTAQHFGDEEALQQNSHYPDYPRHKTLHENFKKTVADLDKKLKEQGPTPTLITQVSSSTGGWLITHIAQEDKRLAAHVKSLAH